MQSPIISVNFFFHPRSRFPRKSIKGKKKKKKKKLTFETRGAPTEKIPDESLTLQEIPYLPLIQPSLPIPIVLGENLLELLWSESSFLIIRLTITAVIGLMDSDEPDPHEWIRDEGRTGRIAERDVDDHHGEDAQGNRPTPIP